MSRIEIVKTPWHETLVKLAGEARGSFRVTSPFVKQAAVVEVLRALPQSAKMQVISSFNIAGFYYRASDTAALRDVLDWGGELRNYQRLHSKVYLFDDKAAVVTSSNLTVSGLTANYEYGVLIRDEGLVEHISADFTALWQDEDTGHIDEQILDEIDGILSRAPRLRRPCLPEPDIQAAGERGGDEHELILEDATEAIRTGLTGWKVDVLDVLAGIEARVLTLADVYEFASELQAKHPRNRNVEAKIRQQLQFLRDLGLVKFLGGGRYKKLWD